MKLIALALLISTSAFAGPFSGLRTFVNDGSGDVDACRYDNAAIHPLRTTTSEDTKSAAEQSEASDDSAASCECCGTDAKASPECGCDCGCAHGEQTEQPAAPEFDQTCVRR